MKAIILAAGMGKRIRGATNKPKCLIEINNETLIARSVRLLKKYRIKDITVVAGYKAKEISRELAGKGMIIKLIINKQFRRGSILSLWAARHKLNKDTLIMDADLYFEEAVVKKAITSRKKNFFLIDVLSRRDKEAVLVGFRNSRAVALARGLKGEYSVKGEWAGFLKLSNTAVRELKKIMKHLVAHGDRDSGYEFIIPYLFSKAKISYELINGLSWVEIDFPFDIRRARGMAI